MQFPEKGRIISNLRSTYCPIYSNLLQQVCLMKKAKSTQENIDFFQFYLLITFILG